MKTMGRVVGKYLSSYSVILKQNMARIAISLITVLFIGPFFVSAQGMVQVPASILEKTTQGITLSYNGRILQHRSDQGWNVNQPAWQAPFDQGSVVYVSADALEYLGLNLPKLTDIRSSTDERFRIVFDLEDRIYIEDFSVEGTITAGRPLDLNMPALAVPWGLTDQVKDINLQLFSDIEKTRIRFMSQQTRAYKLFSLPDPRRLVIDFGPFETAEQFAQQAPVQNPSQISNQLAQQPQSVNQASQAQVQAQGNIGVQAPAPVAQTQASIQAQSQAQIQPQGQIGVQAAAQPLPPIASNQVASAQVQTQNGQPLVQPQAPLGQLATGIGQSLNSVLENASDIAAAAEQSLKSKEPIDEVLQNGVRYRRFPYSTAAGESQVHVIEVTPGHGEFRVVGSLQTPRTISELASGALVGINAGYFDPKTHTSIGLLKIAGSELAEPTRNRASVAFGPGAVEINRVLTQVTVSSPNISGRVLTIDGFNAPARTTVYTMPNARVGVPSQGVIIVKDQRVVENKIGPRTIPYDGYAIVYDADNISDPNFRTLAQLNVGDSVQAQFETNPKNLLALPYAVEAGPLLIENGQSAYNPDYENFENAYILNGRTHQAAIGARADGTVLLVAAEAMVARELIPLFTFLGAEKAMRLDSGSSTQLFVKGELINKRSQRRVVSGIIYLPN